MDAVKWAHFGCISLVRQPLGDTLAAPRRATARTRREDQLRSELSEPDGDRLRADLRKMASLADLIKVSDEDLHMLFRGIPRSRRARARSAR